jgi:hypothetical protein
MDCGVGQAMTTPISGRGEVATRSIMGLLATGRRIKNRYVPKRFGRLVGTEGVVASAPAEYLTLPNIVAVAEEFSRSSLIAAAESRLGRHDLLHLSLLELGEIQAEGSWEGVKKAWNAWFEIPLGDAPAYSRLDAYVSARNAILHGLGALTRKQVRTDGGRKVKGKLASVGISVVGDRLVLPFAAVEDCADVARAYVLWLDSKLANI